MVCPAGLEFNSKLKVCDYPSRANCSSDGTDVVGVMDQVLSIPQGGTLDLLYDCLEAEESEQGCEGNAGLGIDCVFQIPIIVEDMFSALMSWCIKWIVQLTALYMSQIRIHAKSQRLVTLVSKY